jgi:hypothetical protein
MTNWRFGAVPSTAVRTLESDRSTVIAWWRCIDEPGPLNLRVAPAATVAVVYVCP